MLFYTLSFCLVFYLMRLVNCFTLITKEAHLLKACIAFHCTDTSNMHYLLKLSKEGQFDTF